MADANIATSNEFHVGVPGSWIIDNVTLPWDPQKVQMIHAANVKELLFPASKGFVISFGKRADKLRLEGTIAQNGQTAAQLETNYILPLEDIVYKKVHISAPDTRYDGVYVFSKFTWREQGGFCASFTYIMEFLQGGQMVIIA